MSIDPRDRDERDDEPPPYEPPAVIWEETWEPLVLAASCAYNPGQNAACNAAAFSLP